MVLDSRLVLILQLFTGFTFKWYFLGSPGTGSAKHGGYDYDRQRNAELALGEPRFQ